jgi:hypothetical protein
MAPAEPSLRQQLLDARADVQRQIDRLEARYYPPSLIGFVRGGKFPLVMFLLGMGAGAAPFRTNGVFLDNSQLIARLARLLGDIEEVLDGIGPED